MYIRFESENETEILSALEKTEAVELQVKDEYRERFNSFLEENALESFGVISSNSNKPWIYLSIRKS